MEPNNETQERVIEVMTVIIAIAGTLFLLWLFAGCSQKEPKGTKKARIDLPPVPEAMVVLRRAGPAPLLVPPTYWLRWDHYLPIEPRTRFEVWATSMWPTNWSTTNWPWFVKTNTRFHEMQIWPTNGFEFFRVRTAIYPADQNGEPIWDSPDIMYSDWSGAYADSQWPFPK